MKIKNIKKINDETLRYVCIEIASRKHNLESATLEAGKILEFIRPKKKNTLGTLFITEDDIPKNLTIEEIASQWNKSGGGSVVCFSSNNPMIIKSSFISRIIGKIFGKSPNLCQKNSSGLRNTSH